eukprot:9800269-Ditylum_brightwellii.AAC.1
MGQHIAMWLTTDGINFMTIEEYLHLLDDEMEEKYVHNETYILEIKGAKYEEVMPKEVADQQTHLTPAQWEVFEKVLEKMPILFDGKLGLYPREKVHLEVQHNARPYHTKAYSVPQIHEDII